MTTIKIHGILAKEYGKSFSMELSRPRDVIRAIDASRDGFRKRIINLQKSGLNYDILVDRKRVDVQEFLNTKNPKQIDIVPLISGRGLKLLAAVVIAVVSAVVQYALLDLGTIEGGEAQVGGATSSLIFQGGATNISSQGDPLPIGYGRLVVGSNIIQSSIKSIPQTIQSISAMTANSYDSKSVSPADIRNSFINE